MTAHNIAGAAFIILVLFIIHQVGTLTLAGVLFFGAFAGWAVFVWYITKPKKVAR